MRILVVDDEKLSLENFVRTLRIIKPDEEIIAFNKPTEAFTYLDENQVDVAFLDIEMGELSGLDLAKKCKELCPSVNIIFVTGYSKYAAGAFKLRASGYLMKPVRENDLRLELENLRNPPPREPTRRVRVQTFGNFEVFVDKKQLELPGSKCRECLAYLIDRKGARVTYPELSSVLWENRPYDRTAQNNTHRVISDLMKSLKKLGIADIIIKARKDIAINVEQVDCDYYWAISGDMAWMNAFSGEYMANYSWAELTLGELCRRIKTG